MSFFAAAVERSLSVIMTRGARAVFFNSLRIKRCAAFLSRRNIEHEAVLIDGAPQPMFSSRDGDDDFVHMPFVAALGRTTAHRAGELASEFVGPTPDGFIGDVATAGGEHLLDLAQAQGETMTAVKGR